MPKFCNYCGAPLKEGVRFCTGCGHPVAQLEQPFFGFCMNWWAV